MEEIARLTQLFTKLGAKDPEGWARSQVDEAFLSSPGFCSCGRRGSSLWTRTTRDGLQRRNRLLLLRPGENREERSAPRSAAYWPRGPARRISPQSYE